MADLLRQRPHVCAVRSRRASISADSTSAMNGRVLHVLASNDRRGAEVFAVDLARALDALGWAPTIVSLTASRSTATVTAEPIGDGHWRTSLRALRRQAKQHDVVIAHGSTALPACAIACAGAAPFVYRSIGDPSYWSSSGLKGWQTTTLLNRAHTVVALFPAAAETLRSRGVRAELATIPNAVDASAFLLVDEDRRQAARARLGLPAKGPLLVYLGALSREKRPDRAVALGRRRPDLHVAVVGDGPLHGAIEAEAAGVDNVSVLGPTSTPNEALAAADVVIIPSDTEGIPAVAIEAGLSGVPVVASDVGGLSSAVRDDETGYLVPPGDDVAFEAAVDRALSARDRLGRTARDHCLDRFDLDAVARQWAAVIAAAARPTTGT